MSCHILLNVWKYNLITTLEIPNSCGYDDNDDVDDDDCALLVWGLYSFRIRNEFILTRT